MQLSTLIKKALDLLFSQTAPKWQVTSHKGRKVLEQGQKEELHNDRKEI